jgi:hypothetical protein
MSTLACPGCRGPVVEISLGTPDSPLVMRSCSRCDARGWSNAGRTIDLTEALGEIAATGRTRRRSS